MNATTVTSDTFHGLSYSVGYAMSQVREYAKALAPHVDKAVRQMRIDDKMPTIACRGSSGAMLSSALLMRMEESISICHIKKPGEQSHSAPPFASREEAFIIVDDFIETGATLEAIAEALGRKTIECVVLAQRNTNTAQKRLLALNVKFNQFINLEP